jgi:hypothetical protein
MFRRIEELNCGEQATAADGAFREAAPRVQLRRMKFAIRELPKITAIRE